MALARSRNYMTQPATLGLRLEVSSRLAPCTPRRYCAAVRSWSPEATSRLTLQRLRRNFTIRRVGLGLKPQALILRVTITRPRASVTVQCWLRVVLAEV